MEFLAKYDKYCALVQEFLSDDHLTVDYSRFTNDLIRDYMFEVNYHDLRLTSQRSELVKVLIDQPKFLANYVIYVSTPTDDSQVRSNCGGSVNSSDGQEQSTSSVRLRQALITLAKGNKLSYERDTSCEQVLKVN